MKNPVEIIKRDHRQVEEFFKEYEDLGDDAFVTKKEAVDKIIKELRLHTEIEERLLYPKLKDAFSNDDDKMVEEAYVEHDVAKRLLEELDVMHSEDEKFDAKVKVLNESVAHHIKEEEEELLPKSEEALSEDELNVIGEEMEAYKLENETATQ